MCLSSCQGTGMACELHCVTELPVPGALQSPAWVLEPVVQLLPPACLLRSVQHQRILQMTTFHLGRSSDGLVLQVI